MDEPTGRATVAQLYGAINELRDEIRSEFALLRTEMQSNYPTRDACKARHEATDIAMKEMKQTEKSLTRLVYMGVGIAVAVSFVVPLLVTILVKR